MDTPKTNRMHQPRSMSTNVFNNPNNTSVSSIPTPSRSFSSGNTSGTGTGIPAFRSLRSFLPFGPGKSNSTPAKAAPSTSTSFSSPSTLAPVSASPSRLPVTSTSLSKGTGHAHSQSFSQGSSSSKFSPFGTVRRSMTKERGRMGELEDRGRPSGSFLRKGVGASTSTTEEAMKKEETYDDVIAIGPDVEPTSSSPLRRSASFPRIEKEVIEQDSRDLSTIIEADTSGISKHLPDISASTSASNSPQRSNSPLLPPSLTRTKSDSLLRPSSSYLPASSLPSTSSNSASNSSAALNESASSPSVPPQSPYPTDHDLDLSTSQIQGQVLDALLVQDYAAAREWLNSGDAIVVDDDDEVVGNVEEDEDVTQTQGPPQRRTSRREADVSKYELGEVHEVDARGRVSSELGPLDPELAALLSPHRLPASTSSSPKHTPLSSQRNSLQLNSRRSSQRLSGLHTAIPSPTRPSFDTNRTFSHRVAEPLESISPLSSPSRPLSSSLPRLKTQLHPSPLSSPSIATTSATSSPPPQVAPIPASPALRPSPLASPAIFPPPPRQSSPERRLQYQPTPPSPLRGEGVRVFGEDGERFEGHSGDDVNEEVGGPAVLGDSTEAQRIQLEYQSRMKPSALLPRLVTPRIESKRDLPSDEADASHNIEDMACTPDSRTTNHTASSRPPLRHMFTSSSSPGLLPPPLSSRSARPSPASSIAGDPTVDVSPATTSRLMDDTPSSRPRPSLDESRLENGSSRTATGRRGLTYIQAKSRMRKRSMSVEGSPGYDVSRSPSEFGVISADRTAILRSSSSLSNRRDGPSSSRMPAEWMGPRAAKALAAAGLLKLDRDRELDMERESESERMERVRRLDLAGFRSTTPTMDPSSRVATPSFGGAGPTRHGSQRGGGGDFRASSRMAFSDAGGVHGGRKGSGSYSAVNSQYNTPSSYGNSSSYGSASVARYSGRERGGSLSVSATGSAVSPLMESPTFTDRGRGTPASISTAPTSVLSAASDRGRPFVGERDKERERLECELERMKAKHALEMGALLSALSDSQRTSSMLREENTGLRDRLEAAMREVQVLQGRCDEWKWEAETLRVAMAGGEASGSTARSPGRWRSLRAWGGSEVGGRDIESTPARARGLGLGLPSVLQRHRERLEPAPSAPPRRSYEYRNRAASASVSTPSRSSAEDRPPISSRHPPSLPPALRKQNNADPSSNSLAPATKGHRRRSSTTSSVFPNVPANMTMLNNTHSDDPDFAALASFSMSPSHPSSYNASAPRQIPPSVPIWTPHRRSHKKTVSSVGNISPTSANFSMTEVTGSPGSLHLRPEDELHLRDMDIMSLNLARASGDDSEVEE